MKFSLFVISIVALVHTISSCKVDSGVIESDLIGEWEVVAAKRNGSVSETLNGATISFQNKGVMTTDIPFVNSGTYTLVEKDIFFKGESELTFNITTVTPDSLGLNVILKGLNFSLDLLRHSNEE